MTNDGSAARRHGNVAYALATVFLGPLLVAQGWHVRRVTPRLSEPAGPRSGSEGSGPALRLLIAGDSAAAGVGAAGQHEALSGQLVSALSDSFQVAWKLSAHTGHTAQDLIAELQAASPERFDVVLISVGVNDVTGQTRPRQWIDRQIALVDLVASKFGAEHIIFSSLPPMHVFPALPQPLRWYLGARARRLTGLLRGVVDADPRCELLALTFPFEPHYMASDGFHPGPPAYSLWGRAAAEAIRRRKKEEKGDGGN
jgi:lysophospholipase L1-like esterase